MALSIRQAGTGDVGAIVALWNELADFHLALDPVYALDSRAGDAFRSRLGQSLEDDGWCIRMAEVEGHAVGYIAATLRANPPVYAERNYGYIEDAIVTASYRRQGIGQALYHATADWFRERGVKTVQLSAAIENEISLSFWRKQGFREHMIRMRGELK